MLRSEYARKLRSDLTPKEAGKYVAGTIQSNPVLLSRMKALGYCPNVVGYTPEQVRCLNEFFSQIKSGKVI